jgi:glycine oxidase
MTVGHAFWPDQLSDSERAALQPGIPPEALPREPDVLVVGGGILGCATAAACVQANVGTVVLLERDSLGAGASGGAAGLLMPEAHVETDPPEFVALMRTSLQAWRDLDAVWPGGVGLLPLNYDGTEQARVNPLRAIARFAAPLPHVATGVEVKNVDPSGQVSTSIGVFSPHKVVFATGMPPDQVDLPSGELKGHMLVSAPTELRLPTELADMARQIDGGRILMGGTLDYDDHERVVHPEIAAAMWHDLVLTWPPARDVFVEYRWACFRPAHPDHLPVIDLLPGFDNVWMTSGHFKTGILLAAGTGRALAQWMATGSPPDEVLPFNARRLIGAARTVE